MASKPWSSSRLARLQPSTGSQAATWWPRRISSRVMPRRKWALPWFQSDVREWTNRTKRRGQSLGSVMVGSPAKGWGRGAGGGRLGGQGVPTERHGAGEQPAIGVDIAGGHAAGPVAAGAAPRRRGEAGAGGGVARQAAQRGMQRRGIVGRHEQSGPVPQFA